jgi:hypothetical protein
MNSETIIRELVDEHGITSVVLRCPCACDANSPNGKPKADCEYCNGDGKVQYGIDEVEFL